MTEQANIGLMGGLAQLPDGSHVPLITVAVANIMNCSFIVPLSGVDQFAEGFPAMLKDLAEQAKRANLGLVVGADASKLLEGLKGKN